jgi:signal transduction histidine kinase
MKIIEAIGNLIENGIKFNDKEKRVVTVTGRCLNDKFVVIEVLDNGNGIPSEEQKNIFLKFYQIDQYLTGQIEGVGLGLSLVRQLIELHGGKIWVESKVGEGSKFSITLPISQQ